MLCFVFSPHLDNEPHDMSERRVEFQELRKGGGAGNSEGCADASTRQFVLSYEHVHTLVRHNVKLALGVVDDQVQHGLYRVLGGALQDSI